MGRRTAGIVRVGVAALALAALPSACGSSGSPSSPPSASRGAQARAGDEHPAGGRVVVPRLVGERFEVAVRDVHEAGLEQTAPGFPESIGNPTFNGRCKKVLSQSPRPGTKLRRGSTVGIVYGVCPQAVNNGHPYTTPSGGRPSK